MPRKGGVQENLQPWVKGQSGNLKGRPKNAYGIVLKDEIEKILEEKIPIVDKKKGTKEDKRRVEAILRKVADMALDPEGKGKSVDSINAINLLFDRVAGKPKQETDITTDGLPIGMDAETASILANARIDVGDDPQAS